MTADWNAAAYDCISGPMEGWGREVVERLELHGDEVVLDGGCGTGRVTRALIDRFPGLTVLACDASPAMIDVASQALPEATVFVADLQELTLDEPVDVIVSTATFHWIPDHARLFTSLHRALRLGGRLVAQCGGIGNLANMLEVARAIAAEEPYAAYDLDGELTGRTFPEPQVTRERLQAVGFSDVRTWLENKEARPDDPATFLSNVNLRTVVPKLPEHLRAAYVQQVVERMGEPFHIDYVRLNMEATA